MPAETLNLMVVDDEPGLRSGVERALRDFTVHVPDTGSEVSFNIEQCETGEEALNRVLTKAPDIVLLDHMLPGITGIEVLERMPKGAETLVIMITAYASIETAVKAVKQGAYDFLPKPFTPNELRYSLNKAAARLVLARRARQLEQEKRKIRFEFVRILGHELKAPIGVVENFLMLQKQRTLGKELPAYDSVVERSLIRLEHMRKLISDLLDMTRIESGQRARELTELKLADVARHSIETNSALAAERKVKLSLQDGDLRSFKGDRVEVEMIFNNLISNAVKYNKDGGSVEVRLSADEEFHSIQVSDTGIGMTEQERQKLFKEFVRIKNEKTTHILGSGLGLSILKKIAEIYNGSITVDSAPNVGSTFTVKLRAAGK